jgi:type IV secretory pathway TraG/TraD family ATPase VirD4
VSTSTKLDVVHATASARGRLGRCWLFDPSGQVEVPTGLTPLRWSPVEGSRRWDGALLMARGMLGATRPAGGTLDASHWEERAETLLAPLLHAAALDGRGMEFVFRAIHRSELDAAKTILATHQAGLALDVLERIAATEVRERSSIFSTAAGVLAAYRSPAALAQASSPNFDPALFPTSGDTIYMCAPGRAQALVAPIVVGLIEEIRSATYAQAARRLVEGGTVDPPVLLALDEVANVAPIPDLAGIVSDGASQGLLTLACLQDLSQARVRWGQAADGFMSLFGTKVILPGIGDLRTLEQVSALGGETDVMQQSVSRAPWRPWNRVPRQSTTTYARRQRRLPVHSVAQGPDGQALVIDGPRPPAWVRLTPWYSTSPWSEIAGS